MKYLSKAGCIVSVPLSIEVSVVYIVEAPLGGGVLPLIALPPKWWAKHQH